MKLLRLFLCLLLTTACHKKDEHHVQTQTQNHSGINHDTSGYAPVNGLQMYYEIHGEGKPLVLIHGGGSTLQTTFGRVLQQFAKTHRVIAVEMQAHGHTADIDRPLSFSQDADDIAALLKYLHLDKANIFGFSNGASTAMQFAIRHPEMTDKIIVASAFYRRSGAPDWFWDMMSKPTFEGMPQPYKDAFLKINPDTHALHRMYERDVARMQSFPDIPVEELQSIQAPAFIIIGDKDVVTPEHAAEMHKLIKHSRLAVLPGIHGEFIGELTTPQDPVMIHASVEMINKFLADSIAE